jgi:hypothetical protein
VMRIRIRRDSRVSTLARDNCQFANVEPTWTRSEEGRLCVQLLEAQLRCPLRQQCSSAPPPHRHALPKAAPRCSVYMCCWWAICAAMTPGAAPPP